MRASDLIIQIFTFVSVTAICLLAMRSFTALATVRRRLAGEKTSAQLQSSGALFKEQEVRNRFLKWVAVKTRDDKERNKLQRELALAGFDSPSAPIWYVIARLGTAIGLPVLLNLSKLWMVKPLSASALTFGTLILCALGLIVPRAFVDRRIRERKEQIEQEFPDALDLLVVCVDAGLGLEAALVRVGAEVRDSHPRISSEFRQLTQELSAGRSRPDALRAMADRVDVDTIKSFVALVIQTDALGVGIAQTLRTFSNEMREHRMLRAEEKAARVPVLMTGPLVACMLPVIIAALLLPAIIDVVRTLLPAMQGQN